MTPPRTSLAPRRPRFAAWLWTRRGWLSTACLAAGCFSAEGTIGSICTEAGDCGPGQQCRHELCGRCGNGRHESGELCYAAGAALPGASNIVRLHVADLDRDGRDEIVTLDGTGVITHWVGQASGSAVSFVGTVVEGPAAATLAVGDADGDGRGDIVAAAHDLVTVYAGVADGGFAGGVVFDVGHVVTEATVVPAAEAPATLAWVDDAGSLWVMPLTAEAMAKRIDIGTKIHIGPAVYFDDDAHLDLAVVDERQNRLAVVLGGAWDAALRVDVGRGPVAVVGYDRTGDGRTDFLTLDRFGHTISVVATSADGGLRLLDSLSFATAPTAATAFDADLDGIPDVFAGTADEVEFWRGESGRYPERTRFGDAAVESLAVGRFGALPLFQLVSVREGVPYLQAVDP